MRIPLTVLHVATALLFSQAAPAQQYVVDGVRNAVFLDSYNPGVVANIGGDCVADLLSSTIQVLAGGANHPMEQVVIFQSSHNNPCGYFWPLTMGQPIQLRAGQIVKLFVPEFGDSMVGTATVRVGAATITLDAEANGIPILSRGVGVQVPAGHEMNVMAMSSDLSLTGQPGGDRDLDKVLIADTLAQDARSWLRSACVGWEPVSFPVAATQRMLVAFIVDHGLLTDNTGAVKLTASAVAPVGIESATWGGLKSQYR